MNTETVAKSVRLSPMMPSTDLSLTKGFLVRSLGFDVAMDTPEYIILTKDSYDLHLCPAGPDIGEMSAYLEVDDLEATREVFEKELNDEIHARAPFDRDYGMREFHIEIPKTKTLLFVGQRI